MISYQSGSVGANIQLMELARAGLRGNRYLRGTWFLRTRLFAHKGDQDVWAWRIAADLNAQNGYVAWASPHIAISDIRRRRPGARLQSDIYCCLCEALPLNSKNHQKILIMSSIYLLQDLLATFSFCLRASLAFTSPCRSAPDRDAKEH